MASGSSATVTTNWTVPAGNAAHRVYVVVDPALQQNDRDRTNNKAFLAAVKPDLAVREFFTEEMGANHHTITVRVVNEGTIAAPPTTARIYLARGSWILLHEASIPRLDAGQWCDIGCLWNLERNRGTVTLRAIVDEKGQVTEDNETNNESLIRVFGLNPTSSRRWEQYR